jgi:hypothetical protein
MTQTSSRFEAAYVAFRYLLGHRGAALRAGLCELMVPTEHLLRSLAAPERAERARALASALASVTRDIAGSRVDRGQP